MCIQTTSHNETCLLTAALLVLQLLHETPLELFGNVQKRTTDIVILGFQFLIYFRYPVNRDFDALMNISIRDTLRCIVQFLQPLIFQLLAGSLFSHLLQHPFDISCSTVIVLPLVVRIIFCFSSDGLGNRIGLMKRDSSAFLICRFLLTGTGTGEVFRI